MESIVAGTSNSNISVCMATYNGAAFIDEQVGSILAQLSPQDELIVVDDCSTDGTIRRLEEYRDPRIFIHRNERNLGCVPSFQRAIGLAKNPILLLADQDDRWLDGRVRRLVDALNESGALLVTSNSNYMDGDGRPIEYPIKKLHSRDSRRHFRNIATLFLAGASYYGCAMAFRRELSALVLPMPRFVEAHDLWIALGCNLVRSNLHLDAETLTRRIHGRNLTNMRRSLFLKLRSRVFFARALVVLAGRFLLRPAVRRDLRRATVQ
jgi:glycosyltransferase involved in cell wall biosynthesis